MGKGCSKFSKLDPLSNNNTESCFDLFTQAAKSEASNDKENTEPQNNEEDSFYLSDSSSSSSEIARLHTSIPQSLSQPAPNREGVEAKPTNRSSSLRKVEYWLDKVLDDRGPESRGVLKNVNKNTINRNGIDITSVTK